MKKIVLPGGSGYLGQVVGRELVARKYDVVVLSRKPAKTVKGVRYVTWDGETLGPWVKEIDGADAIVHLTGQRVDVRTTKRNVDELIRSRVEPVRVVGEAIAMAAAPPAVWVQSSSLAIYGDGGDSCIDETAIPSGIGPREMVTVCLAWEHAFRVASQHTKRNVVLRIGIGLGGAGDPATKKLAGLVKWGFGGRVGSGKQWISWIDIRDLTRIFVRSLENESMRGVYHATNPNPVSNATLMKGFRQVLGKRVGIPSPATFVHLGAPLLGSSASLGLTGRRATPRRLTEEGFEFQHSKVEESIAYAVEQASQ